MTVTNGTDLIPSGAPEEIKALVQKMAAESESFGDSGLEITMGIMGRILTAASEEEIFAAADAALTSSQDYIQIPFRLKEDGLTARKSTVEESNGFPYYWIMKVTEIESGEEVTLSCGGASAVATLSALRDNGILAKYEDQGGMPLVFFEKAAKVGSIVLLRPYRGSSKK
jgi:hypothetical protein